MHRKFLTVLAVAATALCLCGCFDLTQKVALNRDGSGHYEIAVASTGIVGDALKDADILSGTRGPVAKRTVIQNGRVTRTASTNFKNLSDLALSDEAMSVTVKGRDLFGFGATHAVFRRTFLVQNAKRAGERRARNADDDTDNAVITSMFGDQTYTYSVTVPGSIEWIAPLTINGMAIKPRVTGDMFHGHTVTWRMPLGLLLSQKLLRYSIGFSVYGAVKEEQTTPSGSAAP
ncbi:MAG TPA: hypothetical protein VH000_11750 [Rhizomicrobium sp.]|nr:hypothetical protein [Rhizomicrobium sp.]